MKRSLLYILITPLLVLLLLNQPPVSGYSQPKNKDSIGIKTEKVIDTIGALVDSSIKNTKEIVNNQRKYRVDSAIIQNQKRVIDSQKTVIANHNLFHKQVKPRKNVIKRN